MNARFGPDLRLCSGSQIVLLLAFTALGGCGGETPSASGDATTSESGESSQSSESGSSMDTSSTSETGEPPTDCDLCTEDELCVAIVSGDTCADVEIYCKPKEPACETDKCGELCLESICGPKLECVPECGTPGVNVWCGWGPGSNKCDPYEQDCPEGEKCVPYASTGGALDANKCVPVVGDGGPGEGCTYAGVVESSDDCDSASFCFGAEGDPLMGSCYGFCEPGGVCPGDQGCLVANDEVITLCLDACVPHQPSDCSENEVCLWTGDEHLCMPGVPTLDPNAACDPGDVCAPGQICVDTNELDDCAGMACCTDYCDTSMPDTCTLPHSCVPAFAQGQAPAGLENAGICKLP